MSTRAYVGLGSNLGDRAGNLTAAADALRGTHGILLVALSPSVETDALLAPGDTTPQPKYLNAVAALDVAFGADELLRTLKSIEARLGRTDTAKWAARPIDLDVLLFGDEVRAALEPIVPHPEMHTRRFVLEPLVAIAPNAKHPVLGKTAAELLAALP
jgi:2-amino-4-hydroxy-6-hydroxymethyldihydropteridine diphosphokinase